MEVSWCGFCTITQVTDGPFRLRWRYAKFRLIFKADVELDGGTIIWDRNIVEPFQNADISLCLPPDGFEDRFDRVGIKTSDVEKQLRGLDGSEFSIQLAKHLVGSVAEGSAFEICECEALNNDSRAELFLDNSLWNMATYRDGLQGYWTPDSKFIETSSSRIIGHT